MDMIKNAVRLGVVALKKSDAVVVAMREAGEAFVALKAERGALTQVAEGIAAERGIELKSARNHVAACMRVFNDPSLDTVRAAHSVKGEGTNGKKRFNRKVAAAAVVRKYGESHAEAVAKEILIGMGYKF